MTEQTRDEIPRSSRRGESAATSQRRSDVPVSACIERVQEADAASGVQLTRVSTKAKKERRFGRSSARFGVDGVLSASVFVRAEDEGIEARVRNLSSCGALLECDTPLPFAAGDRFHFRLQGSSGPSTGRRHIEADGVLRRIATGAQAMMRYGVRVAHPAGGCWLEWRELVETLRRYGRLQRHTAVPLRSSAVAAMVVGADVVPAPVMRGWLRSVQAQRLEVDLALGPTCATWPVVGRRVRVQLLVPQPSGGGHDTVALRGTLTHIDQQSCLVAIDAAPRSMNDLLASLDRIGESLDLRLERRLSRRVRPDVRPIAIRLLHPVHGRELGRGGVLDVSFRGVAFDAIEMTGCEAGSECEIELSIPSAAFAEEGAPPPPDDVVRARARLVPGPSPARWAAEILRFERDGVRFRHVVEDSLFPSTTTRAIAITEVWRALADYLRHNHLADLEHDIWPVFRDTSRVLRAHPDLGHIVLSNDRRMTMAFARLYERTWVGHQFARVPPEPGDPADDDAEAAEIEACADKREVYRHAFELSASAEGAEFVVGYYTETILWMVEQHGGFAERESDANMAAQLPLGLWRVRPRALRVPGELDDRQGGIEIVAGRVSDRALLLSHIGRCFPKIYGAALDFTADRLDLATVELRFNAAGLSRQRGIMFAVREGRTVAAGVTELAPPGLSVFGLFDSLRIFHFTSPGELPDEAMGQVDAALVDAASMWFAARSRGTEAGATAFLFIDEQPEGMQATRREHASGPLHHIDPLRFEVTSAGRGYLWMLRASRVPSFLDDVSHVLDRSFRTRSAQ